MAMRMKLEFEDNITERLKLIANNSEEALMNVLLSIGNETKTFIIQRQKMNFASENRFLERKTNYRKAGKMVILKMHPRYQTLEKGAYIRPVDKKVLRFIGKDGTVVYSKHARIPKRPFFRLGVKDAIREDIVNKVAERVIAKEMERLGLL